jgi:hypothetical protein
MRTPIFSRNNPSLRTGDATASLASKLKAIDITARAEGRGGARLEGAGR